MQMCLHFVLNGYYAIHKIKKGIDGLFCDALLVSLIFKKYMYLYVYWAYYSNLNRKCIIMMKRKVVKYKVFNGTTTKNTHIFCVSSLI